MIYRGSKMRHSFSAIFVLLTSQIFFGQCLAEDRISFNAWSRDGFMYENYVDVSRLKKMPDWIPDRGTPHISLVKAIEISRKYISKNDPDFVNAEISSIQLTQFLIPKFYKNK